MILKIGSGSGFSLYSLFPCSDSAIGSSETSSRLYSNSSQKIVLLMVITVNLKPH
jgi:hypothetical protein